jgi:hypothetical protein
MLNVALARRTRRRDKSIGAVESYRWALAINEKDVIKQLGG